MTKGEKRKEIEVRLHKLYYPASKAMTSRIRRMAAKEASK